MKPDLDYMKELLDAFEAADGPSTDIDELHRRGLDPGQPRFLFHLRLLEDRGLIEGADSPDLGYRYARREVSWVVTPIRLTADGHDFAAALRQPRILSKLKLAAAEVGFGALTQLANQFVTFAIQGRLDQFPG